MFAKVRSYIQKKKTPTKQQKETPEKPAAMENKTKKTSTKQQKETPEIPAVMKKNPKRPQQSSKRKPKRNLQQGEINWITVLLFSAMINVSYLSQRMRLGYNDNHCLMAW